MFEAVVFLFYSCSTHGIFPESLLNLSNSFHLGIAKLLAKFNIEYERSSFCKDGFSNLWVRFALLCCRSFPIRQHVAEQKVLGLLTTASHYLHVLWGLCSCDSTRWFLYYRDPSQDGIATWNVPMTPDVETATKESLSLNIRLNSFYKTVICEQTML
jgi:hypothetical protein